MPVIIWINGGFGAGKTTLAQELHRRLPEAVVYDPEDVGIMLWKWMPPNGDFQHLPSWRELVVATALSLRRHHADTLIVPMSLIRDAYRAEILGGLAGCIGLASTLSQEKSTFLGSGGFSSGIVQTSPQMLISSLRG